MTAFSVVGMGIGSRQLLGLLPVQISRLTLVLVLVCLTKVTRKCDSRLVERGQMFGMDSDLPGTYVLNSAFSAHSLGSVAGMSSCITRSA
jgi:hypothetical protein